MSLHEFEQAQLAARQKAEVKIPDFAPGDTVEVRLNIVEGERKRVQAFEGVCIARKGKGLRASFTVRKISPRRGGWSVFFPSTAPPSRKSSWCAADGCAAPSSIICARFGGARRAFKKNRTSASR